MDPISQHLATTGKTVRQLADEVGVTRTAILDLRSRRRLPSLKLALTFEDVAGIPPRAWVDTGNASVSSQGDGAESHTSEAAE